MKQIVVFLDNMALENGSPFGNFYKYAKIKYANEIMQCMIFFLDIRH